MLIRLLRTYLRRYRWLLLAVVGLQAVQVVASLWLPSLNADIIDIGVRNGDTGYIWRHGLWMLGFSVVQIVFSIAAVYYGSKAAMAFGRDVRSALFHKVTDFSAREVAHFGAPSLITRVTNDVQQVQTLVYMTCTLLIAAPLTAIGGLVMALREDVELTWILAVAIPVLVISIGNVIYRMVPTFRRMQERIDEMNGVLREQITGIRVVRAFVREPYEVERFATDNDLLTRTALRGGRLMGLMFPTVTAIVNVSSVAVVWFGAERVNTGDLQVGALIAFLTYLTQILMAVMLATYMAALVPRAAVSSERINEVLDTPSSIAPPDSPVAPAAGEVGVRVDDVGFRYPGAEHSVLDGVSFTAAKGTTTAIIGSTGSGKTTLVNLLARLLDATSGTVQMNGVDVRDLAPEVLWQRIGLVPQRPYLFGGTVASNLRYGKPDATDDEMWAALETAQAADFVRAMGGLEAHIAQGGSNVSGGQRQRLAIARALVRRPDVYVFDDSFSALDMATDARLRAALSTYAADAVQVVVAQRVSSIRGADQILVLEDGEPVGLGTHDQLMATCPTYQEIVNSQLTADEAAGVAG
ncbi:MAG TPA: multidrug ABC transporter ATP-binding protein [Acidimicrobiaceae bacterium]|nr:multidrug ABC transporter ATP-binding protein [Acidimicrobiaceae bacterium]